MKYLTLALVGAMLSSCGVPFEISVNSDKGSVGVASDGTKPGTKVRIEATK